ncbi:MAG: EF-hand domain-containing protein, partial [Planctomycetota bacterium]
KFGDFSELPYPTIAPERAARQERDRRREFDYLDGNGDAVLTWREIYSKHIPVQYEKLNHGSSDAIRSFFIRDENEDGYLSQDEVVKKAWRAEKEFFALHKLVFEHRDANRDGKLSAEEFMQNPHYPLFSFHKMDKDHDGVLIFAEVKGIHWTSGKNEKKDGNYFRCHDLNEDGKVTWEEFRSVTPRNIAFLNLDLDFDGAITMAEWKQVRDEYLEYNEGVRKVDYYKSAGQ